jgi:HAD superfamily hydrolase (TIGR01549 family)
MNRPSGIIFDLGDTLLRSVSTDWLAGTQRLLELADENAGFTADTLAPLSTELVTELFAFREQSHLELRYESFIKILCETHGIRLKVSYEEAVREMRRAALRFTPTEGASEAIKKLALSGIAMGVVSNSSFSGEILRDELDKFDLSRFFAFIISSADYGLRKPNPRIMTLAAKKLGLPAKDIWFVGDKIDIDVAGALQAELHPVWYNPQREPLPAGYSCDQVNSWEQFLKNIEGLSVSKATPSGDFSGVAHGALDIRSLTPTICYLVGIEPPKSSVDTVQTRLLKSMSKAGIDKITRCLVFSPDAIGKTIQEKYPDYFENIKSIAGHEERLLSINPPWTPVCFASMFSGASPEIHGIKKYERPILTVDTLFDSLSRAGKRSAIVTEKNSSMDLIFRNRGIDYFSEESDKEVIERALRLIQEDEYDFLAVYNDKYDKWLRKTSPYSPECLNALAEHNSTFLKLYEAVVRTWADKNWLLVYAPDHGAHFNEKDGLGTHGLPIPEDMDLIHYYAFSR